MYIVHIWGVDGGRVGHICDRNYFLNCGGY